MQRGELVAALFLIFGLTCTEQQFTTQKPYLYDSGVKFADAVRNMMLATSKIPDVQGLIDMKAVDGVIHRYKEILTE